MVNLLMKLRLIRSFVNYIPAVGFVRQHTPDLHDRELPALGSAQTHLPDACPLTYAILPECDRRPKERQVLPPRVFAPFACMRAALNLPTARSSISADSLGPIRGSLNIPAFPF